MTPGRNEQRPLAGALELGTGRVYRWLWCQKVNGLFLDLFNLLDSVEPARRWDRIFVVAANAGAIWSRMRSGLSPRRGRGTINSVKFTRKPK